MRTDVLAAVDIGTNSTHMVVAQVDGATIEVREREREMTRLGSSGGLKVLTAAAMDRTVATLVRFRNVAQIHDAPVRVTATSAVREARNAREFLDRARHEAGVEVDVISGAEEARLIHLGVLQAIPVFDRTMLLCDIGGGSTEVMVGRAGEVLTSRSFKLGAIRLTERFFTPRAAGRSTEGSADLRAVEQCRRHIRSMLAAYVRAVRGASDVAVGSSGTLGAICSMVAALREERTGETRPRSLNNYTVSRAEVDEVVRRLVEAGAGEGRGAGREVPGLDPGRADIILAGALIAEQVLAELDLHALTFSDYALREGVLLDTWQRRNGGGLEQLAELRRRNVNRMVEQMDDDPAHAAEVARLAGVLFDGTAQWHGLDRSSCELLEAGAKLSNVGLFISHSAHHKHSYYVIRHSEHLTGFTDREVELIAQVARYHRRSKPKLKHDAFASLAAADQQRVRVLAGLTRVAVGLDRHHSARVAGLVCRGGEDGALVVVVEARPGQDITLELDAADQRKALLEQALGVPVQLRQL